MKHMIDMSNEDEMTYNFLCSKLEKEGWTKETTFIDEKMLYTTLSSANPGETTLIADIRCPTDKKILIRGTENGDVEKFRDAYSIKLSLSNNLGNEIAQFTKIRITKDKIEDPIKEGIEGISSPIRCFYTDISKGDNDHIYRPRKNILLQGEEHLFIYVIGENIGKKLPDIVIDKNHISFTIKADIFTFDRI